MKKLVFLSALLALVSAPALAQVTDFDPTARDAVVEYGGPDDVVIETDEGPVTIIAEIAETPEQRQRGMMWREEIGDNEGMLFDFGEVRQVNIWMRNTLISLDVIYIREDGTIAKIIAHAQPLSRRQLRSDVPVASVLEIGPGRSEALGIEPGDLVRHDLFGTVDEEPSEPVEETETESPAESTPGEDG